MSTPMTRAELRAALVERALSHWYPNGEWDEESRSNEIWARHAREEAGTVIDALGILDAVEALDWTIPMASAHVEHLARQPSGHQEFIREERDELKKAEAALRRIREGQP